MRPGCQYVSMLGASASPGCPPAPRQAHIASSMSPLAWAIQQSPLPVNKPPATSRHCGKKRANACGNAEKQARQDPARPPMTRPNLCVASTLCVASAGQGAQPCNPCYQPYGTRSGRFVPIKLSLDETKLYETTHDVNSSFHGTLPPPCLAVHRHRVEHTAFARTDDVAPVDAQEWWICSIQHMHH